MRESQQDVRLPWTDVTMLRCRLIRRMCCAKYQSPFILKVLFCLVAILSLLTLIAMGLVEEFLSWSVSSFLVESRHSELRMRAASFNATTLNVRTSAFYYIANNNACLPDTPFLLSFVVSAPSNFKEREIIRKTWSSIKTANGHKIIVLFALGMPGSQKVQVQIDKEFAQCADIVQGLFTDTYRNLTLKTVMIMRWVATFCSQARYVLKVDDDVYVNMNGLIGHLQSLGEQLEDLYFGRVHWRVYPERNPSSKAYVPVVAYPDAVFPSYCSGTAYVVSGDVALKIYVASLEVPSISVEDIYVGICTQKMGIWPTHSARMAGASHYFLDACCYQIVFTSHHMKPAEMEEAWQLINTGQKCTWLQQFLGLLRCKLFYV